MRHHYMLFSAILLCCICFLSSKAQAEEVNLFSFRNPIQLDVGESKRMHVTFKHMNHKGVKCRTCHHESVDGTRYAKCSNENCHSLKGAKQRESNSIYMAYHSPETNRSCYTCHKTKVKGKFSAEKGCRPCHLGKQARAFIQAETTN